MKRFALLFLLISLLISAGCSASQPEQPDSSVKSEYSRIMDKPSSPRELIEFADHKISLLSKEDATQLVLRLESTQQKQLDSRTEAWLDADLQAVLQRFDFNITMDDMIKDAADEKLKNKLIETRDSGFKLIPLEGAYYPIINYEKYKIYQPYVDPDLKAYIDIAASESEQQYLNDAALTIPWPELARRTIRAEEFISKYPASVKSEDVRQQYDLYVSNYLYGANNTPAFDYQTQLLNKAPRQSYYETSKNEDGKLAEVIRQYIPILEKNQFKRAPEVEQFLKNAEQSLHTHK